MKDVIAMLSMICLPSGCVCHSSCTKPSTDISLGAIEISETAALKIAAAAVHDTLSSYEDYSTKIWRAERGGWHCYFIALPPAINHLAYVELDSIGNVLVKSGNSVVQ